VRRPPVCAAAALTVACLSLAAGCGSTTAQPVPYTDLTRQVGPLEFARITISLCKDRNKLLEILERNNPGRTIRLPSIDFSNRVAYLIATGPRSSTGYDLRIVRVSDQGGSIVIVVHERTPGLGDPATARVTYPFRLITLPRGSKPVKLKWPGRP
jgi:hypothetical protein